MSYQHAHDGGGGYPQGTSFDSSIDNDDNISFPGSAGDEESQHLLGSPPEASTNASNEYGSSTHQEPKIPSEPKLNSYDYLVKGDMYNIYTDYEADTFRNQKPIVRGIIGAQLVEHGHNGIQELKHHFLYNIIDPFLIIHDVEVDPNGSFKNNDPNAVANTRPISFFSRSPSQEHKIVWSKTLLNALFSLLGFYTFFLQALFIDYPGDDEHQCGWKFEMPDFDISLAKYNITEDDKAFKTHEFVRYRKDQRKLAIFLLLPFYFVVPYMMLLSIKFFLENNSFHLFRYWNKSLIVSKRSVHPKEDEEYEATIVQETLKTQIVTRWWISIYISLITCCALSAITFLKFQSQRCNDVNSFLLNYYWILNCTLHLIFIWVATFTFAFALNILKAYTIYIKGRIAIFHARLRAIIESDRSGSVSEMMVRAKEICDAKIAVDEKVTTFFWRLLVPCAISYLSMGLFIVYEGFHFYNEYFSNLFGDGQLSSVKNDFALMFANDEGLRILYTALIVVVAMYGVVYIVEILTCLAIQANAWNRLNDFCKFRLNDKQYLNTHCENYYRNADEFNEAQEKIVDTKKKLDKYERRVINAQDKVHEYENKLNNAKDKIKDDESGVAKERVQVLIVTTKSELYKAEDELDKLERRLENTRAKLENKKNEKFGMAKGQFESVCHCVEDSLGLFNKQLMGYDINFKTVHGWEKRLFAGIFSTVIVPLVVTGIGSFVSRYQSKELEDLFKQFNDEVNNSS